MAKLINKKCEFCVDKTQVIDYKNLKVLYPYINYFAKIKKRYYSGICLRHQKMLANSIKKSRFMALLPFTR